MKKCIILLVEDNEQDAFLVREAFEDQGFVEEYFHVVNGIEALKFLNKEHPYENVPVPDFILMDINMPIMDGHETLARIKSTESLRHIPVLMLTTSSRSEDILKAYQEHSNSYIVKPEDIFGLDGIIENLRAYWCNTVQLPKNTFLKD